MKLPSHGLAGDSPNLEKAGVNRFHNYRGQDARERDDQDRQKRLMSASSWSASASYLLFALAAPFLGSSYRPWAWGALSIWLGLMMVVFPPKRPPGGWLGALMVVLLAGLGAAFLPRWIQPTPSWRVTLEDVFGIATGEMLSAQPWISLDCIALFGLAMAWVCVLLDPPWTLKQRHLLHQFFVAGLFLIVGISLVGFFAKSSLPFWHNERFFGPFPNRNQMATLLAMAVLLTFPPLIEDFRGKNPRTLFWSFCLAVFLCAIVLNYSRAGLLLVICGGMLWALLLSVFRKTHLPITLMASTMVLFAGLFLFFGGDTLKRFMGVEGKEMSGPALLGFRIEIYRDAFAMIFQMPVFGVGLGNFEPVFQFYREVSKKPVRVIHPESDWLWMIAEAGAPWAILFTVGLLLFARRAFPLERSRHIGFRLMAISVAAAVAFHGLFDVSGHRLGSVFPAMFIFALAIDPLRKVRRESPVFCSFMRIFGLVFILYGSLQMKWGSAKLPAPGFGKWLALREETDKALASGQYEIALESANQALAIAPLDWRLYFQRALAKAQIGEPWWEIASDFRRARALEQFDYKLPLAESKFWAKANRPLLAGAAWREATRRSPKPLGWRDVEMTLEDLAKSAELRNVFRDLAGKDREQLLDFLLSGTPEEFEELLAEWLSEDPELASWSPDEKRKLFAIWWQLGDRNEMVRSAMSRPDWLAQCWEMAAIYSLEKDDACSAFRLADRFVTKPTLPPVDNKSSLQELQSAYGKNKGNFLSSYSLYERLRLTGKSDEALSVASTMAEYPGAPHYWYYLLAKNLGDRAKWNEAWRAIKEYHDLRKRSEMP